MAGPPSEKEVVMELIPMRDGFILAGALFALGLIGVLVREM
jgi:hypothetical protein